MLIALKWGAAGHTQIRESTEERHGPSLCLLSLACLCVSTFGACQHCMGMGKVAHPCCCSCIRLSFPLFFLYPFKLTAGSDVFYRQATHNYALVATRSMMKLQGKRRQQATTSDEPKPNPSKRVERLLVNQQLPTVFKLKTLHHHTQCRTLWLDDWWSTHHSGGSFKRI